MMINLPLSLFCIALLLGCASNEATKQNHVDIHSDYFQDSSACHKIAEINAQPMIPAEKSPVIYLQCMKKKGWTVER